MEASRKQELVNLLDVLFGLDRFASCSDRYFRQVYTAKIMAIQAGGYRDELQAEIDAEGKDDKA